MLYYFYLIKSHGKVLDYNTIKLLIESLVFSHLTYALSAWSLSLKQHLVKHLQNRIVCLLYHLHSVICSYLRLLSLCRVATIFRIDCMSIILMYYILSILLLYGRGISLAPTIRFGQLINTRTKYFIHSES